MRQTIPNQDRRIARLTKNPTCSHCGATKTIAEFPRSGVHYWCSACCREWALKSYYKRREGLNPEQLKELRRDVNKRRNSLRAERLAAMPPDELAAYKDRINAGNLARRNEVRDKVFNHYGGYKCQCCGETERAFLSLDHINNDGSKHKREEKLQTGEQMHRWIIRNGFPPMFQVLCMNCNWGKRNNGGVCPHQADKV